MKFQRVIIGGVLSVLLLLLACAAGEKPVAAPEQQALEMTKEKDKSVPKEGWEARWEKTLEAARKEGKVVVYGGSAAGALKRDAVEIVKKKFGFELEALALSGSQVIVKIRAERNAGVFIPDVYTSGGNNIFDSLKPMGAADPIEPALILPEVLDSNLWFGGKLPWGDEERKALIWAGSPDMQIVINTALVQPGEIKSYYDLLEPKWKGKIVINDPTTGSGAAFSGFTAMAYNNIVDVDFFRQLVGQQQPVILRDPFLQVVWVARGRFPVGFWPSTGRIAEYFETGAPLAWVQTKEGVHLSGGGAAIALMNRAPHPNAAAIFLNWLLSKEGQLVLQNGTDKQTLRVDVPTDKLDPLKIRQPGVKYYPDPNTIEKFVLGEYEKFQIVSKEIFTPGSR